MKPSEERAFATREIMWALVRYGGSLRIGSLLGATGHRTDLLCEVCNELQERGWIEVAWRRSPRAGLPERLRRVDRVTATRFGRSRVDRAALRDWIRYEERKANVSLW